MARAVFAHEVFVKLVTELLPTVDFARFSSTCNSFHSFAAALARADSSKELFHDLRSRSDGREVPENIEVDPPPGGHLCLQEGLLRVCGASLRTG